MKQVLTLIALSASTALLGDCCKHLGNSCKRSEPCCEHCEPCCVPEPKLPICCECYVPSFDDMECDWGLFVTADFLYWYADETDLSYAALTRTDLRTTPVISGTGTVTPALGGDSPFYSTIDKIKRFESRWKPGVRVGLGCKMDGGWDLYSNWTYYTSERSHSITVTPFSSFTPALGAKGILNPWASAGLMPYPGEVLMFDSLSAKWNLVFNQIDLELGRRYWLSECFTLRPYAGLRAAWTHTTFEVKAHNDIDLGGLIAVDNITTALYKTDTKDHFRNRNWGVGLIGGLQPTFFLTEEFSLYANAEMSLLWGQLNSHIHRDYTNTFTTEAGVGPTPLMDYHGGTSDNFSCMQPVMDLGIGLRWETCFCDNRYRFNLDAGWEHHVFFNYNRRVQLFLGHLFNDTFILASSPNGRADFTYQTVDSDLGMGGFVLRARFDF